MDYHGYIASRLVRERHAELVAAARQQALASEARGPRRRWRSALGTALIRAGARLLRDDYAAHGATG